jgi:hypothetical protein
MKQKLTRAFTLIEFLITVIVPFVWIGTAFWIERNVDFWISRFKGVPFHLPFVYDLMLALLAGINWTVLIISEILRYIVTN